MAYQLGVDPAVDLAPAELDRLQKIEDQQATLLEEFRASERNRRLSTLFALGGAVFAAFRLGILAFPSLKAKAAGWRERRAAPAMTPNPGRPRRRRRFRRR